MATTAVRLLLKRASYRSSLSYKNYPCIKQQLAFRRQCSSVAFLAPRSGALIGACTTDEGNHHSNNNRTIHCPGSMSRTNAALMRSASFCCHDRVIPRSSRNMSTAAPAASGPDTIENDDDNDGDSNPVAEPYAICRRRGVRNVAIIAHVDHGKTTLVDRILLAAKQSAKSVAGASASADQATAGIDGSSGDATTNRLMDSGELEKERGITITSKVTRLEYYPSATVGGAHDEPVGDDGSDVMIVNCVDTPGHADFCGEVDRILSMVDGVVLVVDAVEGPKTQTKYVMSRAVALGLHFIVLLNKCDRPEAATKIDSGETEHAIFDLMDALGATEERLDYTTLYASAKQGWATLDPLQALEWAEQQEPPQRPEDASQGQQEEQRNSIKVLLDCIVREIPEPAVRSYGTTALDLAEPASSSRNGEDFGNDKFSLAAVNVGYDQYLGRTCTGRIFSGSVGVGDRVQALSRNAERTTAAAAAAVAPSSEPTTIADVFVYKGIDRIPLEQPRAFAGDVVTIAGVPDTIAVGDTLTGYSDKTRENCSVHEPIETPPLAPPTMTMDISANNGPLAGQEGRIVTASRIRDRLFAEADNNVTLNIQVEKGSEKTTVAARGELQLGILVEQMRREGYEFMLSPPRVLTRTCDETGRELEPFEEVTVDVDSEFSGAVVSALTGDRKGILMEMNESPAEQKSRLIFQVPTRGLLGFNSEIAAATRGSAVVNHLFLEERPYAGVLGDGNEKGKLVSNCDGKTTLYALSSLAARGTLFVEPGEAVYSGVVVGENAKVGDLNVNPVRAKEVNNMRTQNKDETLFVPPAKKWTIEELIGYMSSDEVIEVTPKSVRLRKQILDASERDRVARQKAKQRRSARERQKAK